MLIGVDISFFLCEEPCYIQFVKTVDDSEGLGTYNWSLLECLLA